MKKIVFAACLLLLLVSLAIAENPKYEIYSESKGFLGLGGKKTMMLDKETGDSWVFQDGRWVAIPKVEAQLKAEEEKAKLVDEISSLKAKQEEEIKAIKAKQDAEIKALESKQGTQVVELKTETVQPKTNWRRSYKPKVAAKAKEAPAVKSEGEEGPPSWLNE